MLINQVNGDSDLLARMSPLLQSTVALTANKRWLDRIWFFRDLAHSREGVLRGGARLCKQKEPMPVRVRMVLPVRVRMVLCAWCLYQRRFFTLSRAC